jgi:F0F1-type ATP synthase assembly protein I
MESLINQPPPDSRELGYYFALGAIGTEMVAPIGLGLLLDYFFNSLPWATVVCAVLGFTGGMVHLVLLVQKHDAEEERRRKPPGGSPQ